MKKITLITAFLISFSSFSQGLNGEIGFNDEYWQSSHGAITVDEFSYFINYEDIASSYFSTSKLVKVDTLSNVIWSKTISPQFAERLTIQELTPSENGGVYLIGLGMPTCDAGHECFSFIQKYDSNGNIEWSKNWTEEECGEIILSGISLNINNDFLVNYSTPTESKIYTLNSGGVLIDSLFINQKELKGIVELQNLEKIAYKQDSIFKFDNNGSLSGTLDFSSEIQNIKVYDDTIFILTNDSIFSFDSSLAGIESTNIPGHSDYSNLKVYKNKIEFISHSATEQKILTLNRQFTITNILNIPITQEKNTPKDFNDLHFTTTINFSLTKYTSIRHLDFSRNSVQNVSVNSTDIGIIDIQETSVAAIPFLSTPNVYTVYVSADVLIKNYGNNILNECRINHFMEHATCGDHTYSNHFSNLNLAPNDSMWITLGNMHSALGSSPSGAITQDICVFTSHPNYTTDLNISNDEFCKSITVGYVGLNENEIPEVNIYPNPTNSFLNIETDQKNIDYKIYSMQGVLINQGDLHSKQIDVSKLSNGMYVLQLNAKDGSLNFRKQFLKK
ncbi:T9SS type A sorting domain-containing protein [Brumimicrobium mesophilum]|uniref:T9SS type A sorting domain-containing protein n=1 Tax=Brumimicrobium mesophilum TaxID=392717 RepID=UPI000D142BD2|nr:T9SS type A sorting domain-containing protein [Brumimicrobium mesophilum]